MQNGLSVQVGKLDYATPPCVEVRLLVVDDNAVFREELGGLLEGEGHSVALAASGSKALEILATQPADVVLTDLKMPRMGGLALLTQITGTYPEILVVVITGYATIDTAVEAMRLGAFDYLRSPAGSRRSARSSNGPNRNAGSGPGPELPGPRAPSSAAG